MATVNIYNMADTWNNVATTFTAIKMNVTDTASASASLLADLQVGGVSKFAIRKDGSINGSLVINGFVNAIGNISATTNTAVYTLGAANDVQLARDAANTLAQRNGTNAQAFRVYNTYTDGSNYERVNLAWSGNDFFIEMQNAGTGSARNIVFRTGATDRWKVTASGHFIAAVDNTIDIGASGANRPRNVFAAGGFVAAGTCGFGAASVSSAHALFAASTTAKAQMNLVVGVAPSAPNDGDVWREDNTNTGLKIRVNGVTKTITLS